MNSHEIVTGDFTRDTEFSIPSDRLALQLEARLQDRLTLFDASELARATLGDSIFSNVMIFGAAWQMGLVPLSHGAITQAITLNGAAVKNNLRAFEIGRWAVVHPDLVAQQGGARIVEKPKSLEEKIAFRADHLVQYQGRGLSRRYRRLVDSVEDPRLKEAVAKGYHKLLAYKDEYEVARLHQATRAKANAEFDGDFTVKYHLAAPLVATVGADGRPGKREFGVWMGRAMAILPRLKALRGTRFDPFGRSVERRMERALITQFEADMREVLPHVGDHTLDTAIALAELPLSIRGFGPVKAGNAAQAEKTREALLATFRAGGAGPEGMAHAAQ